MATLESVSDSYNIWTPHAKRVVAAQRARWRDPGTGPLRFARDCVNYELVPDQVDYLAALSSIDTSKGKFGVTVRSGHKMGKTVGVAIAALWFHLAWDDAYTVVTASKQAQIFDNVWPEMQRIISMNRFLSSWIEYAKTRIGIRGELDKWQIVGRTASRGENIAGAHSQHKLILVDEASGVDDDIFEPLIAGLGGHNLISLTGNPTRRVGEFYRSHSSEKALWHTLHLNGRNSPLVSAAHIARMEKKYGANSPIVRVRIDGEFPPQSDLALFNYDDVMEASRRELYEGHEEDEVIIGVDVAWFGDDSTCVVAVQGPNVLRIDRWNGRELHESAAGVMGIVRGIKDTGRRVGMINVDAIGYGAGVYSRLCEEQEDGGALLRGVDIMPVNVSKTAHDKADFPKLRDELWFRLARCYERGGVAYDRDAIKKSEIELLQEEITPIEYTFSVQGGKMKVMGKDAMRDVIGHSPDVGDAMCLAMYDGMGESGSVTMLSTGEYDESQARIAEAMM